jgi:amino acid transporter
MLRTGPPAPAHASAEPSLHRALGHWDLTAIGVNQVIGSGIFLVPAALYANVGGWSPMAVAVVAVASLLIALCFAEVGSRFEGTGGAYLYTRAAFGRFPAFEVGWMLWFTRAASWASVINGLADALSFYWPALAGGAARPALIAIVIGSITAINVAGIRQSAWVVNAFTIAKLLPLLAFIAIGAFFIQPARLAPGPLPPIEGLATGALLLIFTFGGYEVVPVPAGEAKDPRRAVPFAMVMTIVIVTVVMGLAQIVAQGTLPDLGGSRTPLADSAVLFMGAFGGMLMTAGAAVSMTGNNVGQALSGSRNLFALAEQGDLPAFFGRVHRTFRTPANAIVFTSAVVLVLALTGTFATLAAGSAISRLIVYVGTCASTLALRRPSFQGRVQPAAFTAPLGPLVPGLAILISVAIIAGATQRQLIVGVEALAAGAVLYLIARARRKR